ncbi:MULTISPECIES: hypothetical protein [Halomonadaceae]|uniref:Uncharacterized protein n=1 Tax=Vreelandella sp. SM1641 TaxID=3126101 RepID=A0AAU7XHG8_9GAMM|nr:MULTISPECIES: hypothetical protein [Halomonas]AJY50454.1 hypothetical protein KO116_01975 [Halomonas sp. KO116]|tara:strand:- start:2283 stop:2477 length:195 start_codon:yes stop_codon:yes gene_type:complete
MGQDGEGVRLRYAGEAAQVCASILEAILPTLYKVRLVRFVLFNEVARHTLYQALAQRLTIDAVG